jgi:hypothetical protein
MLLVKMSIMYYQEQFSTRYDEILFITACSYLLPRSASQMHARSCYLLVLVSESFFLWTCFWIFVLYFSSFFPRCMWRTRCSHWITNWLTCSRTDAHVIKLDTGVDMRTYVCEFHTTAHLPWHLRSVTSFFSPSFDRSVGGRGGGRADGSVIGGDALARWSWACDQEWWFQGLWLVPQVALYFNPRDNFGFKKA